MSNTTIDTDENHDGQLLLNEDIYGPDEWEKEEETTMTYNDEIIFINDSITTREGRTYHDDNIPDDVKYCEDIGEYSNDWQEVLVGRDDYEYWNDTSNTIEYEGETYSENYAERCDIYYCDNCGDYVMSGDCSCGDEDDEGHNEYHNNNGNDEDKSGDSRYKVGIEFEKCDSISYDEVQDMKGSDWRCETDSSCGYEYISPILPFDNYNEALRLCTNTESKRIMVGTRVNSSCGGHIHISDTERSPEELYRDIKGYRPLLFALYPHRVKEYYCDRKKHNTDHATDIGVRNRTIEIRIFPGISNEKTLKFRLALVHFMLENPAPTIQKACQIIGMKQYKFFEVLGLAYDMNSDKLIRLLQRMNDFYNEVEFTQEKPTNRIIALAERMTKAKKSDFTKSKNPSDENSNNDTDTEAF